MNTPGSIDPAFSMSVHDTRASSCYNCCYTASFPEVSGGRALYEMKTMNHANLLYALMNIASGLLFIVISVPLVLRRVGMNYFYGFRFRASLRSEDNWFAINAYGGRQLIICSVLMIAAGVGCLFLPAEVFYRKAVSLTIGMGPFTVLVLVATFRTYLFARSF